MNKFVLLLKSYKKDFIDAKRLVLSIEKHNIEKIPIYLSVNDEDYDYFRDNLLVSDITLLKDSDIIKVNIKDKWRYQQIVKSQFYRLNVCKNYLCIDSDSFFIRDFRVSDFMYDENTPYTVMHEAKSFLDMLEIIGIDSTKNSFKEPIKALRTIFNSPSGKEWDFGPSPYIWSTKVWKHLAEVYLVERGLTFEDFFTEIDKITIPAEGLIYGEYLLKTRLIDIFPIEGLFKVYHFKKQFDLEKKYYDIDRLKKNYMGIIFQSNWAHKKHKFWKFW
ncbi:DUF6492 family protein [Dysgonomonas sp. ZJ709]|uniref:DUF6492 family protein n=1 Tax=Dysgonomonas sp. ZJ709 TaxID=2709797 RepID=UPI0013EE0B8E|nr:DUF6492 family protein [Dysgonomonas sp. ZJ709]